MSIMIEGQSVEWWVASSVLQDVDVNVFDSERWRDVIYVLSALFFSIAIDKFKHPSSANMGNFFGFVGMMAAIGATLASAYVHDYGYYVFMVFIPAAIMAAVAAMKIEMTSMPQMVGMLNALGGLAAALESFALYASPLEAMKYERDILEPFMVANTSEIHDITFGEYNMNRMKFQVYNAIFYILGMVIGTITFTGSVTACLKLAGKIPGKAVKLPARNFVTVVMFLVIFGTAIGAAALGVGNSPAGIVLFVISAAFSAAYGVLFVIAIGGADMPVVISVLNSLSGWSTVFAGLTFNNSLMIIAGTFVGASGIILSVLMCRAMNRSLKAVLLGDMGTSTNTGEAAAQLDAHVADAELCARYLAGSRTVCIIPGYGMAVSRAQHVVAQLADALRESGRQCRFAAHPVAGRLPGHMNVLLSEASVPYDTVDDLDTANPLFKDTDTCIVIGANDTVNPSAVTDKGSPIYGMPVLQCWEAKRTIVIKRSLNMGYAGIENPLFFSPNTSMLLGDGKAVMETLLEAFRAKSGSIQPDDMSPTTTAFIGDEEKRVGERSKLQDAIRTAQRNADLGATSSSSDDGLMQSSPRVVRIGVLNDKDDGRVYLVPKDVEAILKKPWNAEIYVEERAGLGAGFTDAEYKLAGATVMDEESIIFKSNIILKVRAPTKEQVEAASQARTKGACTNKVKVDTVVGGETVEVTVPVGLENKMFLCAFGDPSGSQDIRDLCCELGVTFFSSDIMPRVTAAQAMDVLSSTAKIAGYRAVLEAAHIYGRLPGPEITAAGSYPPAKALVLGCGVAGLQAIGDCHRLGMDVRAFDVRKECAEQVVSMGGKFLLLKFDDSGEAGGTGGYANVMSPEFIDAEMKLFAEQCPEIDIIICTAAIPGRRAPILLKDYHIHAMKKGSVLVDLAAATGGNCELTKPGETYVTSNGTTVVGQVDFVQTVSAPIASEMLSGNVMNWFGYCFSRSNCLMTVDMTDGIIRAIALAHGGHKLWPAPRPPAPPAPAQIRVEKEISLTDQLEAAVMSKCSVRRYCLGSNLAEWTVLLFLVALFVVFSITAPDEFLSALMVMILGAWTGFLLVNNVTSALHTPLMSLTNAISGVVILAGILGSSPDQFSLSYMASYFGVAEAEVCGQSGAGGTYLCEERGLASVILNGCAIFAASLNVVGGFAVTKRMLSMFVRL